MESLIFLYLLAVTISFIILYLIIKAAVKNATKPLLDEIKKLTHKSEEASINNTSKDNLTYNVDGNCVIFNDGSSYEFNKSMGVYRTETSGIVFHNSQEKAIKHIVDFHTQK